jgi:sugar/nucleoside kinase (ribokinase family)
MTDPGRPGTVPAEPALAGLVVAVGDVFLDHVSDLSGADHSGAEYEEGLRSARGDRSYFAPLRVDVGGAGVQFAVAARQAGFAAAALIGKVGAGRGGSPVDEAAGRVAEELARHGVQPLWAVDPVAGTGAAVVLYRSGDRRLMLCDPGANATFGAADVTAPMRAAAAAARLVHVSGYALLAPGRRAAVLDLVRQARSAGAIVAVDVVPHDIDRYLAGADVGEMLAGLVDVLLLELCTARRVLGLPGSEDTGSAAMAAVLERLAGWSGSIGLTVGPRRAMLCHRGECREYRFEYRPGADNRGHSARVQAALLGSLLRANPLRADLAGTDLAGTGLRRKDDDDRLGGHRPRG